MDPSAQVLSTGVDRETGGYSRGRPEFPVGEERIVAEDGATDDVGHPTGPRRRVLEEEHRRLVALRRAVSGDVLDGLGPTAWDPAAVERRPADSADTATRVADRDRDQVLLEQLDQELRDVDDAIGRLDRGEYGLCELCGEPIGRARLEALPATRLCVRHQMVAERRAVRPGVPGRGAGPAFLP